jgi:hypothetical protein
VAIVSGGGPRGGKTQGRSGRRVTPNGVPPRQRVLAGTKAQKAALPWRRNSGCVAKGRECQAGSDSPRGESDRQGEKPPKGESLGALSRRNKRDCASPALIRHVGSQTQKAAPLGVGTPGTQRGRASQSALKGTEPRESVSAGAGRKRRAWSETPKQSQDLREDAADCLTTGRRQPARGRP